MLFGKRSSLLPPGLLEFSIPCISMDSLGGESNKYKSKRLLRHGRCEIFHTRKNIAVAEYFRTNEYNR